jgi:hypothetical protein
MNSQLQARLRTTFLRLNKRSAVQALPKARALTDNLDSIIPDKGVNDIRVPPKTAELFATASVDIWLRAVHSFLVSASLTKTSPVWASVSGYYSSHYSVRAFAHLLGYFLLYTRKRVVRWSLIEGHHICSFSPRGGGEREHKVYWNWVKRDEHFKADPMFREYAPMADISDVRHRDRASYADHLFPYPNFYLSNEQEVRNRIQQISRIEFLVPPVPDIDRFMDIESVQIVAYHRLVRYRQFLDEALGGESRFWNVHRSPTFASGQINFQLVPARALTPS